MKIKYFRICEFLQEKNKMNLSSEKLQSLGWKSKVGLEEAYVRLIKSFKN